MMQEIHDTVIQLKTIIIGNGIKGMAEMVQEHEIHINLTSEDHKKINRHEKLYYGTLAILALANIALIFFR